VNEAARLTDLAKSRGGIAASGAAVALADPEEARHWQVGEAVVLRGRGVPTDVAVPRSRSSEPVVSAD
jgi:adenylate cyclase